MAASPPRHRITTGALHCINPPAVDITLPWQSAARKLSRMMIKCDVVGET
jgi:hypothetical protein